MSNSVSSLGGTMKPIIWIPALLVCGLALFAFLPNPVLSKNCEPLPVMDGLSKQDWFKALQPRIQQCPKETFDTLLTNTADPELFLFVANERKFRSGEARPYFFEFAVSVHNEYSGYCKKKLGGHWDWFCLRYGQLSKKARTELQ